MGDEYISTEHLFVALLKVESRAKKILGRISTLIAKKFQKL